MSEVLYRKYRPLTFAEVIGQEAIKTVIQNAVRLGRVSHAYLFTGPRGVGKTTIARILAKAVNCLKPKDGEPDTKCVNCELVQTGRFLDLLEIDAASYTGVDNIRDIIDHVKFAPNQGRYKVFIIDEVHMLSKAAFNALLKTLEEPPAHAIFILATTEVHKVPATIISRSQRFDFRRVSQAEILSLFKRILKDEKLKLPEESLKLIAQAADGSFRDGLSILDQVLSMGEETLSLESLEELLGLTRLGVSQAFLEHLLQNEAPEAVKFIKNLVESGKDLVLFCKSFLEYLQLILFVRLQAHEAADLGLAADEQHRLLDQANRFTASRLLAIIKGFLEAYREIKYSPVPELPLLTQVLFLCKEVGGGNDVPEPAAGAAVVKADAKRRAALDAPSEASKGAFAGLELGMIIDRWGQVLEKVKDYNHALLSSLRLGRIVRLEGQHLVLAFPYNFHKETIEARKNRIVVEQVLTEVFAQPLKVQVHLERDLQEKPEVPPAVAGSSGDLLGEAMRILGANGFD